MTTYPLWFGDRLIPDIYAPRPEDIDLCAVDNRLRRLHRWCNDPLALTIDQHQRLVAELLSAKGAPAPIVLRARYHDDAEAILGDWPRPLKTFADEVYDFPYNAIETAFGWAIWRARDLPIDGFFLSEAGFREIAWADSLAAAIEWRYVIRGSLEMAQRLAPIQAENVPAYLNLLQKVLHDEP